MLLSAGSVPSDEGLLGLMLCGTGMAGGVLVVPPPMASRFRRLLRLNADNKLFPSFKAETEPGVRGLPRAGTGATGGGLSLGKSLAIALFLRIPLVGVRLGCVSPTAVVSGNDSSMPRHSISRQAFTMMQKSTPSAIKSAELPARQPRDRRLADDANHTITRARSHRRTDAEESSIKLRSPLVGQQEATQTAT